MVDAGIDPADLARLQQAVLVAVLSDRPVLPGGPRLQLPDLRFATRGGGVSLSPENLAAAVDISALPGPVRLMPAAASAAPASDGHIAFAPADIGPDAVGLTLQVRATPPGDGRQAQAIGSLRVRFRRENGEWRLADPPAQSAS